MARENSSDLDLIKQLEEALDWKLPRLDSRSIMVLGNRGYTVDTTSPQKVQGINLDSFKLQTIPPVLSRFQHLERLSLCVNQISDLTPLAPLTNLAQLHFGGNQVSDLTPLAQLTNLTLLSFGDNQVNDMSPLAQLTNLVQLECSGNQVSDLSPLAKLNNLEQLLINNNRVSNLTPLAQLANLKQLYFFNNQVSDLTPLAQLANLVQLAFFHNQVSDLTPLSQLPNLRQVNTRNNRVIDLTPLAMLNRLQKVDARDNHIKSLPSLILETTPEIDVIDNDTIWWDLKDKIYLAGNPLEQPPWEIIKQGKTAMRDYFRALEKEKEPVLSLQEVKVLLVGDGGSGKTSLVKQLLGHVFNDKESQTHGINITPLQVNTPSPEGTTRPITAYLWDFGGQEIMHASHQFFLSKRSLYILVLDGRKDEKTEYWLKHTESFGGNSPVLVVMNKIDENSCFDLDRFTLKKKYPNIKDFYRISCKTGAGIAEFKTALAGCIPGVELLTIPIPRSWLRVKEKLQKDTAHRHYVGENEFKSICAAENIEDESSRHTLVEFLNELGVVLHFHTLALRDFHVLAPRWVTEAVYRIINSPSLFQKGGIMEEKELDFVLNKEKTKNEPYDVRLGKTKYSPPEQRYIISLMQRFELCYTVGDRAQQVLIPDLLPAATPVFEIEDENIVQFRLRYDFLPRSVMARFIVKSHTCIKDELRWRSGVVLAHEDFGTTARVTADEVDKTIYIEVAGDRRRDHLAVIRDHFREINKSFEKIKVDELIPLPGTGDFCVEYSELTGHEAAGKTDIFIGKLRKSFNVSQLLDGIERKEERHSKLSSREWEIQSRIAGLYPVPVHEKQSLAAVNRAEAGEIYKKIKEIEIRIETMEKLQAYCDGIAAKKASRTTWLFVFLNIFGLAGWVAIIILIKSDILDKWAYILAPVGFVFQAICSAFTGRKFTLEDHKKRRLEKLKQEQYVLNRFSERELKNLQDEKKRLENSF